MRGVLEEIEPSEERGAGGVGRTPPWRHARGGEGGSP